MQPHATSCRERALGYALPALPMPDLTLMSASPFLRECVIGAISPPAQQARHTATLDRGDPGSLVVSRWIQCVFESFLSEELVQTDALRRVPGTGPFEPRFYRALESCLAQYHVLLDIQNTIEISRLHRLEEVYSLRNAETTKSFLHSHPQLLDVLLEASNHVRRHFGASIQVALEVVRDPEVEDRKSLFAYIMTSLPVDEALERLKALDEDWFLGQLDRVEDLFNFNLEFV